MPKNQFLKIKKQEAKLLGLNTIELAVLTCIREPIGILDIARKTHVSRTTLYPHVTKLLHRGLLMQVKRGRRIKYIPISQTDIGSMFLQLGINLANTSSLKISGIQTKLKTFVGKKQLSRAWLLIGNQPIGSKVISIQPTKSLKHSIMKVPHSVAKRNHKLIISRRIFMEQFCEDDMYVVVLGLLKKQTILDQMIPDFLNRRSSTYLAQNGVFDTTSELFILNEGILILDWKDEFGILIENQAIQTFMSSIIHFVKISSRQVNQKEEIEKTMKLNS